jgi:hypothetical protein
MAAIEDALFERLKTFAGLMALVSTRIYPVQAPQNPIFPLVVYQRITTTVPHNMGADLGPEAPYFQLNSWARGRDYTQAKAVAAQVRAALRDYSATVLGVVIQRIFLEDEQDLGFDLDANATGISQDYRVWHS